MKFFVLFIIAALVALFLGPFVPYWGLMFVWGACAALIGGKRLTAFFAAGLGVALVWFALPMWITVSTGSELPARIGNIMGLENPILLVLVTCLLGFFIAGLSALTGNSFRKIFEEQSSPYYK